MRLILLLAVMTATSLHAADPLQVSHLQTEYRANPEGVESLQPRLQWQVQSRERGEKQTAYRVLVASAPEKLQRDEGDLWDTGKVEGAVTAQLPYAGKTLGSGQACFWKVRAWDRAGEPTPWSEAARWSMGLLTPQDWQAEWISFKDEKPLATDRSQLELPAARYYLKTFEVPRTVKRATLYLSALGLAEMQVNGRAASDAFFESGWSDYTKRAYYRVHDVTSLVHPGTNQLQATVTDGWYAGYVGYGLLVGYGPNHLGRNIYGKTPAFLAQLDLEYDDGSREIVGTDRTWRVTGDGPVREADLLMGESYDARMENRALWKWEPAIRAEENGSTKAKFYEPGVEREVELGFQKPAKMQAYAAPPVRALERMSAQSISEPKPGTYIFHLPENIAGTIQLKIHGPAGTQVQIRYGEMLHPDGRLMTENLRKARATDFYTLRGASEGETWLPRFTYHGFQYVELTGLPERPALDAVTGVVLSSDTPATGEFRCSDPVMTQFWQNTVRTQRSNFIELPTDCPQRDERLGWMGDAQIYARTASYNADVSAFFTKWLDDVAEAQRPSGAYPDYCPYPFAHGAPRATNGTAWTDAGVIVPYTVWQMYGDTRLLTRQWDSMAKFMEWRRSSDPECQGVKIGNTWGDWLNVGEDTPIEYIDLCYHRMSAVQMMAMGEAIGKETAPYTSAFAKLGQSFRKQYLKPDGSLTIDTQTAYVLALQAGFFDRPREAELAGRYLADKIAGRDGHMATGFLGTKPLLPVLSEHGQNDLALRLFQSRQFPSWGYEVEQGATSVWERWDSFTKEHGFDGATGKNNAAMNSFSHYSFGAVMQWGYQTLAGIDAGEPGFQHIVIRPHPPSPAASGEPAPLDWVQARYDSIRGRIASEWRTHGDRFELKVTIPANTSATVYLPSPNPGAATESGKPLGEATGVKVVRYEAGTIVLAVDSGSYEFQSRR